MTIQVAGNAVQQQYVALAQSGQTPAQEPVGAALTANVGSLAQGARGDHVHPLGTLGRTPIFGGYPPHLSSNVDYVFDGAWSGTISGNTAVIGFQNYVNNPVIATLSGSVYSVKTPYSTFIQGAAQTSYLTRVVARNITVNAGVTLQNAPGQSIALIASQSITISGTVSASGSTATGATGGLGTTNSSANNAFRGFGGATGTTASGAASTNAYGTYLCLGGAGGTGGSGTTAGGGSIPQSTGYFGPGVDALMYLYGTGTSNAPAGPAGCNFAQGGAGGSAGGGDATNAGGGGGGGGAFIILLAPQITIASSAVLTAAGGNAASGVAGNAGGGGGGGGGFVNIHGLSVAITSGASISVAGGTGGAGAGTGSAGGNGATMLGYISDPSTGNGGYGFGAGCLICQWQ